MKILPTLYKIVLLCSLWLFTTTGVHAQLQKVATLDGYRTNGWIELKEAILIPTDVDYPDREYFLTDDFQNFVPATPGNNFRGHLNLRNHSYLVLTNTDLRTLHYIVRINQDLSLDTVSQFTSDEASLFDILDQQGHYGYFGIGDEFFRFSEITLEIENIDVSFLNGLDARFFTVFTNDEALFMEELGHLYRLAHTDSAFSQVLLNDSLYSDLSFFPTLKVDEGLLVIFNGTDSVQYSGILLGDSVIGHINALPAWPDASTANPLAGTNFPYVYRQYMYQFKSIKPQRHILGVRSRKQPTGEIFSQVAWYSYDTISNRFWVTQEILESYEVESHHATYNVGKSTLAFSNYKNKGLELVKLHRDSVELLRDNFPGMASGSGRLGRAIVLDDKLYYMATHPYYGYSLHRSDGSRAGTGVLASLDKEFKGTSLRRLGTKIYLVGHTLGLPAEVFEVTEDSKFLKDKYYHNSNEHWNQSIYSNIYTQYGFGPANYNRPKMKTSGGLILSITSSHSEEDRFFPEEELKSPYHSRTSSSWHLTRTYALYDTSGQLLLPGYVRGYWGTEDLAIGRDTTVFTFFRHKDFSYTNFDTLDYAGYYNYFKAYNIDGSVKWSQRLSTNFEVIDMEADEEGNLIVIGKYEEGGLSFFGEYLSSPYSHQYFAAKIDASGNLQWAVNSSMEGFRRHSNLAYLHLDEKGEKIYLLISEGSYNVASSCRYSHWLAQVIQIDANTGNIDWSQNLETNDLAVFYGITTSAIGEVWVAGWFRGAYLDNGEVMERATGTDCPKNGLLICLDKSSGRYKKSMANPQGSYGAVHATDDALYTLWYSYDRILNRTEHSGDWATTIEQRDLSGIVKASYQFPSLPARSGNLFQLEVLDNSNRDWLMFSGVTDGYLISDSLYEVGVSLDWDRYNTFLMRRSGQIFQDLKVMQPIAAEEDNPFSIYPNPAYFHEVFVGASSGEEPFTDYQLISLDGRVVASGSPQGEIFPQYIKFPTQLRGLYLLRLFGSGTPQTFKLHL